MRYLLVTTAVLFTLAVPAAASAETLQSQIDVTSPQSTPSQNFETSFDRFDAVAADDFAVPAGEVWELESAFIRGNNFGASTTSSFNVGVLIDNGGLPGTAVHTETVTVTGYPDPTIPLTNVPVLDAGVYWLSVQANLNGDSSANPQQWFWAENDDLFGNPAAYTNPGGGFSNSCQAGFGQRRLCLPDHPAPDQSWALTGTRTETTDPACEPAKAKLEQAKKKLKKAKADLRSAGNTRLKQKAQEAVNKAKDKLDGARQKVKEACS